MATVADGSVEVENSPLTGGDPTPDGGPSNFDVDIDVYSLGETDGTFMCYHCCCAECGIYKR